MKKLLKIFGIVIVLLIFVSAGLWYFLLRPAPPAISPEDRVAIRIMPLPAELKLRKGQLDLNEGLGHEFENTANPRLKKGLERFYHRLHVKSGISVKEDAGAILRIRNSGGDAHYPGLDDDESYSLQIDASGIVLEAPSDPGILYGLETLLQLIESNGDRWVLPALTLHDHPRYPWRGIMIDAARHWIPKEVILRNLDAMAQLKMNVFHWHLSDYQGFRVESKVYPRLHGLGSNGNFYTQEDIKEIVSYAADRSIRIVPEFDIPGHATSWLVGYPDLGSAPGPYSLDTVEMGVFRSLLDPSKPEVYAFIDNFIGEMTTLFPDPYLHIGGDEVMPHDWEQNPRIGDFMKNNNLEDYHDLQAFFNVEIHKILSHHGRKMQGWDEVLHPDLPQGDIIIQSWRNHRSLWESARRGYKAILSTGYYLDHKKSAGQHYSVDPEVIKGAVNIEIDSTNWASWKSQIKFGETVIEGNIYRFGPDEDMSVIMDFMENATSISNVEKTGNTIEFENETDYGTMHVSLALVGDSLKGQTRLSLFDLELTGIRTGGSDMKEGIPLPKFERIEPLNAVQASNILGGEACMWTEMVDSVTLESRIWPRAAAIAEKLWSPKELTTDVDDMYRRLIILNDELEQFGLMHKAGQKIILQSMVGTPQYNPVKFLVDYLQEGEFLDRLSLYDPVLYTFTPLDLVVDAASAESYPAYEFNGKVEHWLNTGDKEVKQEIMNLLEQWIQNDRILKPVFEDSEKLRMVQPHSENLRVLSEMALEVLNDQELETGKYDASAEEILKRSAINHGGTVLAVLPGLEKIIRSNHD